MKKIAVIGSLNMDYVIETDTFPKVGETVLGNKYQVFTGGKGANQAIAASKLGGNVSIFGSIGDDSYGEIIKQTLQNDGIRIDNLQRVQNQPSGSAFIELSSSDNRIIVVPGSNSYTNYIYAKEIENKLDDYDIFLFQLEVPIELMEYLVPILYKRNKTIICNPAPARSLDATLLDMITYIIPNEHEVNEVMKANTSTDYVIHNFPFKLIVTLGSEGAMYSDGTKEIKIPSIKVKSVDTTGAGDTFVGAFAVAVSEGKDIKEAVKFANVSGAVSVTKQGAQLGMPFRKDIENLLLQERAD